MQIIDQLFIILQKKFFQFFLIQIFLIQIFLKKNFFFCLIDQKL